MKKSYALTVAAATAVLLASVSIPTAASAATTPTTAPNEAVVKSQLATAGVSAAAQTSLVMKMRSGVPWDSMTTKKPASTETKIVGNFNVEVRHYADGSVSKVGVEIPQQATPAELATMVAEAKYFVPSSALKSDNSVIAPSPAGPKGLMSPMATGIRLCTYGNSAGVYYASNCQVYYDGISWSSSFRANYQRYASGAGAQYVTGTRNTVAYTLTVSDEVIYSLDSGTRIRYALNLHPAGWGNIPFTLDLKVSPSQAYATNS